MKEFDTWPYLKPKMVTSTFIPKEFFNRIYLHILKNQISIVNTALILAIQGPKGEGKSFQVREVCSKIGVYVIPISGAMLSGSFENEAVKVFQEAYTYASILQDQVKKLTILLIDDFDLSVASQFDDRKYTVNTQLLSGSLMNLADDPNCCGNKKTNRIPIIVTGNNFKALHPPLTRHGRMNFFEWKPNFKHKISIVNNIFKEFLSTFKENEFNKFIETYWDQPISFFIALKDDIIDDCILQNIEKIDSLDLNYVQNNTILLDYNRINIQKIYYLADKRQKDSLPNDYISKTNNLIITVP